MGKKHRIKLWLAGGLVLLLAILTAAVYHTSYPVEADGSNLEMCIAAIYNRGSNTVSSPVIKIYDSVTLGNRSYVLIEPGEDLGSVVLESGATGRDRIDRLSYGGGNFRNGIIEREGKTYLLHGGRNTGAAIADMTFTLNGFTGQLEIPQKAQFLVCMEIDSPVEDAHLDLERIHFFNAQGQEITEQYDLSGGGF